MKENRVRAMHTLGRLNKKMFSGHGRREHEMIGRGQANVLEAIVRLGSVSQDELAQELNVDKTTIAKTVKKLEIHELITRVKSEEDSRKKIITATGRAVEMNERMNRHLEKSSDELFEGISDGEIESLLNVLTKLEANVEEGRNVRGVRRELGRKVFKTLEAAESVTMEQLVSLLKVEEAELQNVLSKMIERETIKEENGVYTLDERPMRREGRNHRRNHMYRMDRREDRRHMREDEEHMHRRPRR